jgi:hypothetical protein
MKYLIKFAVLSCFLLLFYACSSDDDSPNYANLAIGKWINTETNGTSILTDASFIMELRADKVEFYATGYKLNDSNKTWNECSNFTYSINNDIITVDGTDSYSNTTHLEMKILTLNETTMKYSVVSFKVNGVAVADTPTYTMKKITKDYSSDIIGIWYGKCTNASSADTNYHYWEYLNDGTYNYYYQDSNNKWVKKTDNGGHYFLYGDYLASNYSNDLLSGSVGLSFECWNFSITNSKMTWTGLRADNKTVTYEMNKVDAVPVSK